MIEFQDAAFNSTYFFFAAVVAIFVVMLLLFTFVAYHVIQLAIAVGNSMPCAMNLRDIRPGQRLLAESRSAGRDVVVVDVALDSDRIGGGFIITSERTSIRVPMSALVLVM